MLAAVKGIVQGDTVQADVACKLSHGIQVLLSFGDIYAIGAVKKVP